MSGFAVRNDGLGWYMVSGPDDVGDDHYFSATQPAPVDNKWGDYQSRLQDALTKSDITMGRIQEAVVLGKTTWQAADVIAYVGWRSSLRDALRSPQSSEMEMPEFPGYPAGT